MALIKRLLLIVTALWVVGLFFLIARDVFNRFFVDLFGWNGFLMFRGVVDLTCSSLSLALLLLLGLHLIGKLVRRLSRKRSNPHTAH